MLYDAVKERLSNTVKAAMEQSLPFCHSGPKRLNIILIKNKIKILTLLGALWQKVRDCSIEALMVFNRLTLTAY